MTISAAYAPDNYAGDDSTDTFAVTFAFLSVSTNVKVSIKVDATSVITVKTAATHYNVTGSNVVFTGGNIPATGETIIIELDPDFKQTSDYTENSSLPAETLETDLDERTLESQFNKDQATRAVRVDSAVDLDNFDATLPTPVADKYIGFNGDATAMITKSLAEIGTLGLPVAISDGGTGSVTASAARSALGVSVGSDVQAYASPLTTVGVEYTVASASTAASLGFKEDTDNGTNTCTLKGPTSTANVTVTLPAASDTLIGKATSDTLTNKTIDANGTGNSISNIDVADLANGTDGELITWNSSAAPTTVAAGTSAQVLTSNGAGAAPTFQTAGGGGKVLQVVSTTKTNTFTTSSGTFVDVTGMSVTITPSSTSNKIYVLVNMSASTTAAWASFYKLIRGSTSILEGDSDASNRIECATCMQNGYSDNLQPMTMMYLDSPSTTSATTYKIQSSVESGGATTRVNYGVGDGDDVGTGRAASTITVFEIDGT